MSKPELPKIDILYEDDQCLAVNKPAGLMVHSDGRSAGPFLTDWINEHYPEVKDVGDPMNGVDGKPLERGGIVHRLDRETSGVILIAKTVAGHASLKKQFQERSITKRYVTFVWGEMREEFGTIDRPIGRSGSDFRKYSAGRGAKGDLREAVTFWVKKGLGIATISGVKEKFSFLEVEPKTGRTHQIRVHLSAINHPVLSDNLYAPRRPRVLGFERLALHSRRIEFSAFTGSRITVEAPLPADFLNALRALGIEYL